MTRDKSAYVARSGILVHSCQNKQYFCACIELKKTGMKTGMGYTVKISVKLSVIGSEWLDKINNAICYNCIYMNVSYTGYKFTATRCLSESSKESGKA